MKNTTPSPHEPAGFGTPRGRQTLLGIAGAAAGAALCAAVLSLFALESSAPWLPDSPEALARVEACQSKPQRSARTACVRQVIAQWQADARREVRVAAKP